MNIVKELHATARKNYESQIKEAEQVLNSVKENLRLEDVADKKMIKFFGTGKEVPQQKRKIEAATHNMKYAFVNKEDVEKVCIKYYLRFLPARLYKKDIPAHALNDLRKFQTSRKLSDQQIEEGLMMIAPANHFVLGKRPKNDPVLLWQNQGFYNVVSQWGNDFTWLRIAKSVFNRFYLLVIGLGLLSTAYLFFKKMNAYRYSTDAPDYYFFIVVGGSIIGILSIIGCFTETARYNQWDEPYK